MYPELMLKQYFNYTSVEHHQIPDHFKIWGEKSFKIKMTFVQQLSHFFVLLFNGLTQSMTKRYRRSFLKKVKVAQK